MGGSCAAVADIGCADHGDDGAEYVRGDDAFAARKGADALRKGTCGVPRETKKALMRVLFLICDSAVFDRIQCFIEGFDGLVCGFFVFGIIGGKIGGIVPECNIGNSKEQIAAPR